MYEKELALISNLEKLEKAKAKVEENILPARKIILVTMINSSLALFERFLSVISKISPKIPWDRLLELLLLTFLHLEAS